MGGIWTVARHTFRQCVRTKVAIAFGLLLAASLALLPSLMEGDGTLAGRIRTFLDYSTTAVSVLLAIVVVFLSVGVVSGDVRDKHVFVVCSKPVARWQYILGRWLGVVLLSAMLLGGSALGVWTLAQYLRGRGDLAFNAVDRRTVETEVFTARQEVRPEPPDVDGIVAAQVRRKRDDGTWDEAVESYKINYGLSQIQAAERLVEDMRKAAAAQMQSAGPGRSIAWSFRGIRVVGEGRKGPGLIRAVRREAGFLAVQADQDLVDRLILLGPVWVNGVAGRALGVWKGGFRAVFNLEDMNRQQMVDLAVGQAVEVAVEPTIQLSYKVKGGALKAAWKLENAKTGFTYDEPPRDIPTNTPVTLIAPARVVDDAGGLRARFINYSPVSVTVLRSDLAALYEVGGFGTNFLKTAGLMLMGLMFLAALGIFAGSALSFPVGCLVCFVMLWIATALRFLTEAISLGLEYPGQAGFQWAYRVGNVLLKVMRVLLPDLGSTLGTSYIVDGVVVPWGYFAEAAGLTVAVRGAILLALACVIFHRRELARVQV